MNLFWLFSFLLFGYIIGVCRSNYIWRKKALELVRKIEIQKLELRRYRRFFSSASKRKPREEVIKQFEEDLKFITIVKKDLIK